MRTTYNPTSDPSTRSGFWVWPIRVIKGLCLLPVYVFFGVPLFLVLAPILVASLIWTFFHGLIQSRRDRRFLWKMQASGRFIEWPELEPKLVDGQGTLVIEQANKRGLRVWWTPEDVASISPFEIPRSDELSYLFLREETAPYVLWCRGRFLDETKGTALLTEPSMELPGGLGFAEFFQGLYPRLRAIDTVLPFPGEGKPAAIDELL